MLLSESAYSTGLSSRSHDSRIKCKSLDLFIKVQRNSHNCKYCLQNYLKISDPSLLFLSVCSSRHQQRQKWDRFFNCHTEKPGIKLNVSPIYYIFTNLLTFSKYEKDHFNIQDIYMCSVSILLFFRILCK